MDWLAQNWVWVLFALAFVALHLFGHGGHRGHGGHGRQGGHGGGCCRGDGRDDREPSRRTDDQPPATHQH